jgi:hypothetical protein
MNTPHTSQNERIARCLWEHLGSWVSIKVLAAAAECFAVHSRVADLRKRGWIIENRQECVGRQRHSYYRILNPSDPQPAGQSSQSSDLLVCTPCT